MKNISRLAVCTLSLAALLCALPCESRAGTYRTTGLSVPAGSVPNTINYQGRLIDNGFPVNATRSISFRIYDSASGGTLLYTVPSQQVVVSQGVFGTTLAISTTALAGTQQKYLEVQIDNTTLAPREPLNSVPYALVAKSLEDNLAISTVTVGSQFISSGTLAVASLQALNGSSFFTIISPVHMSSATLTIDGNAATALTTVGNVGVGLGAPIRKLDIQSSDGAPNTDGILLRGYNSSLKFTNSAQTIQQLILGYNVSDASGFFGPPNSSYLYSGPGNLVFNTSGNPLLLQMSPGGGNVGIGAGATAPATRLDVDGNAQFGSAGTKSVFSALGALTLANNAALTASGAGGNVVSQASVTASAFFGNGAGVTNVTAANVAAGNVLPGSFQNAAYTFPNAVNFPGPGLWSAAGLIGVGTANPATKLHLSSGTLTIDGNAATSIVTTGQVGIGVAPSNPLSVAGNANVTGTLTAGAFSGPITGNATTASNLTGGAANQMPYQTGASATTFVAAPGANMVLSGNSGAPFWTNTPTFTGTNISGTAAGLNIGGNAATVTTNANLTGNVTSVGNATTLASIPAISGAALTNLTAANISAGTAGINISGNAATVTTNANLTGNVTSVGNATTIAVIPAVSGAALTNLTAANISAGTAGISITGNAATATSANALAAVDATGQSAIAAINAATAGTIGTARINAVNTVAFSATPTFNAALGNMQKITLTGNVTASTLTGATAGQTITFLICQDVVGSRTFAWPVTVKGATAIGGTLSTCSAQKFIFDGTFAYATAAGVVNQ